ncbi:TetR/AcrR family transcriptional regulator [Streptomyces sp. NPDC021225]|uniref:TetR/AcrR family transcriptional regulator n=1 Tax=Streptomyces sp. NPDC021225 TaxID=3365121 RepID=UPI00379E599D
MGANKTTAATGAARSPMRARYREQVREDVKAVALDQLAQGGATAVSVNAIAKQLGVSGPALYRYFAGRDELLAELVIDTYHDFAAALAAATDPALGQAPAERLRALATAWRAFARAEPHRYTLMFAPPVPGYDAHSEPLVTASREVMAVGLDVAADLWPPDDSPAAAPGREGDVDLDAAVRAHEDILAATGAGPEQLRRVLSAWTRLHGFVSLEIGGNFTSMGIDADALFAQEVSALSATTA